MITMYDSVDLSQVPANAQAVAVYVDGRFANVAQARARFPKAHILSIAVFARDDADCLDIERGNATPDQAAGWAARQFARGLKRPCLYASASVMQVILESVSAAGISRDALRLWSAHYTMKSHVCGPRSCREMTRDADGTQWTDRALGRNLDQSLLRDDFFGDPAVSTVFETVTVRLPDLKPGMTDAFLPHWYIRRLQLVLSGIYGLYKGAIDGIYGNATMTAVKALQGHLGLIPDGICGKSTWSQVIAG